MDELKDEVKKEHSDGCKHFRCCAPLLKVWWIKSLIGFIIVMALFCLGVMVGGEIHERDREFKGFRHSRTPLINQWNGMPNREGWRGDRFDINGPRYPIQNNGQQQQPPTTQQVNPSPETLPQTTPNINSPSAE